MSDPTGTARDQGLPASSPELGARFVVVAGIGLVGYGVMFLVRNFTGFIELGLTYLDAAILLAGTVLAYRALSR